MLETDLVIAKYPRLYRHIAFGVEVVEFATR